MSRVRVDPRVDALNTVVDDVGGYDRLIDEISHCHTVLIGDATHGTDEFYRDRALITRRLIDEHDFGAVAIEADWPDAWNLHRFAAGTGGESIALDALNSFTRFPTWMWRNTAMIDFLGWLHEHNASRAPFDQCAVFGLDLYSMHRSADRVIAYLEQTAPESAERARQRYACLDGQIADPIEYARDVLMNLRPDCERELVHQLTELSRSRRHLVTRSMMPPHEQPDAWLDAVQNAVVARNAERYYRTLLRGDIDSWNVRDRHMAETLARVQLHLASHRHSSKTVVWAHNSHVGDARATDMGRGGQVSLGQLVRQYQGHDCALIGFTTYHGSVTAASSWGGTTQRMMVRPALPESCEALLHQTGREQCLLVPSRLQDAAPLRVATPQRAIGVVYHPEAESEHHYFSAVASRQFDAIVHIDATRAIEPLEDTALGTVISDAETWPFGT
jgi:erythromycin esterase-like protein